MTRFVLTVILLPPHWVLVLVGTVVLLAFGLVADLLRYGPGGSCRGPSCGTGGDAEFYRARAHEALAKQTRAAASTRNGPVPPWNCAIPVRKYRAVGAGYVLRIAEEQGWALRQDRYSDLPHELRLRYVADESAARAEAG
ncbi:hypothetical protein [Streptomyces sp. NBC_01506]|uniref:hypothetical protein n=1 Tax=Streptomyces sp. NBC_01506 TaxID=2903887 RepID=UPI00386B3C06